MEKGTATVRKPSSLMVQVAKLPAAEQPSDTTAAEQEVVTDGARGQDTTNEP